MLRLIQTQLQSEGYEVQIASSLADYDKALDDISPSLIIMDVEFIDVGRNVLGAVRQHKDTGRIECPVLFLPADDDF